jgi:hypothetical protein
VVLSWENLCLINHLKLFWPQTASDKKCQIQKCFCSIFVLLINFEYDSKAPWLKICWEWQLIDTIKICLVSLWLYKFFYTFEKWIFVFFTNSFHEYSKNWNKKTPKAKNNVEFNRQAFVLSKYWVMEAQNQKKIYQIRTKNEKKHFWILTLFNWGCWGCLRSKKFQTVDQAYFSTTQDHTKLDQKTNNSNSKSLKQFKNITFCTETPCIYHSINLWLDAEVAEKFKFKIFQTEIVPLKWLLIKRNEYITHKVGIKNEDEDNDERAVGRSENPGVPVVIDGHNLPVQVDIESADLPKSVSAMAHPTPLAPTGLKEENAIICKICNTKFLRKAYLKKHVQLKHTATNLDYKCEHCNKKFISKNTLSTHINRTHMNQKFCCKKCKMSYSRKFSLLRHKCKS